MASILAGVVVSLLFALLLRLLVVDFYRVPGHSMEPALEPGDFILVDKVSFGARMFSDFDFLKTGSVPHVWRVKGFSPVQRGEVLVFNFPYLSAAWNQLRMDLSRFYIKRCIGLPGDTLAIRDGFYVVNGKQGFGNLAAQDQIAGFREEFPGSIYWTIPFEPSWGWTIRQMGPLYIPARGDELRLDSSAVLLYHKMIAYEMEQPVSCREKQLYCGDSLMTSYCFQRNWYFLGGDNNWNSQDSRYLGLIPEDFIIGKARLVLSARNPENGKFKWKRFFTKVR